MNKTQGAAAQFAMVAGIFLLIEGIWGHFSPVVFGIFTTNALHAAIHVVLGLIGIATAMKSGARTFCLFLGVLLVAVGALRFVPVAGDLILSLLNVNTAVAVFNIVVGAVAIMIARASPKGEIAAA